MGVRQWVFQRISNVTLVIFGLWLFYFLASPGDISHLTLVNLFSESSTQIYLAVTLVLAGLNSILAGWQITGDYAEKFHINSTLMITTCVVISLAYIAIGIDIIF